MEGSFRIRVVCPDPTCNGRAFMLSGKGSRVLVFDTLKEAELAKQTLASISNGASAMARLGAWVGDEPLPDHLECPACHAVFYPAEAGLFVVREPAQEPSVRTGGL